MALYTGLTGRITVGEEVLGHISGFTVDSSATIVEALSLGDQYKEKVATIKDWTASSDGSADFDTASNQALLITAFQNGTAVDVEFYLNSTPVAKMSGNAYVESLSISLNADGKGDISISLSGNGKLTYTAGTAEIPPVTP